MISGMNPESPTETPPCVLLVDDDVELVGLLHDYLEGEGFAVTATHDGEAGANAALSGHYDIVVLDVMMPRVNGLQALTRIRAASQVPVLMLTARGDDTDRIVGLELGADDYVAKPCTPRELVARLRSILKRAGGRRDAPAAVLSAGGLQLWPGARRAEFLGRRLDLTGTEFSLLEVLVRNAGRPVDKATLSEQALGKPLSPYDRSIDVHVSRIRQKMGPLADGRSSIQTVVRKGYQLLVI